MRSISYDPLWKTLIDRKLSKSEFVKTVGISKSTLVQLNHNESVTLDTILRICNALDCDLYDVVETKTDDSV